MKIPFSLNGKAVEPDLNPMARLLDVLRSEFGLTSVKEGCGEGECGACTVLIDGEAANSCLVVMGNVIGRTVNTVESVLETPRGRMIADALAEQGGVQCGFCSPGFVVATDALLTAHPNPTDEQIRHSLSGNLCRCTGYQMIIDGVRTAADKVQTNEN